MTTKNPMINKKRGGISFWKKCSLLLTAVLCVTVAATACGDKGADSGSGSSTTVSDSSTPAGDSSSGDDSQDSGSAAVDGTVAPAKVVDTNHLKYAYGTLSEDEKKVYDAIVDAVVNFKSSADLETPITVEQYKRIFGLVYFQESKLFWLDGKLLSGEGEMTSIPLLYRCSLTDVAAMQAEIDKKVAEINKTLPADATIMDKIIAYHDYIVLNNQFTKEGAMVQTVYGALVEGGIQCEGYAKALAYLCDTQGIENAVVTGNNSENNSHAWNIIKMDDGEWYNVDTTWDDPMGHEDNPGFIRYNYFGATDAEIINKTHFPFADTGVKYFELPACTATKYNYFNYKGLTAGTVDEAVKMLTDELVKASENKVEQVQIKASSKAVLDQITSKLVENQGAFDVIKDANKTAKNKFNTTMVHPKADENCLTFMLGVEY